MVEVLQEIAMNLDFNEIQRHKSVCKIWKDAMSQESFWRRYVKSNYDFNEKEGKSQWLVFWYGENLSFYMDGDPVLFQ